MKKKYITIGLIILFVALLVAGVIIGKNYGDSKENTIINSEQKTDVNVAEWLKITKICEYDGNLAVVVKNESDIDVEYASLTVKNKEKTLSFDISVLLSGTEMMLVCNENVKFDPNAIYTGWETDNIIYFEKTPIINDEKIEVSLTEGSISVRNMSAEDITSDIVICYKEKIDGVLNGSMTHRVRVSGLKSGAQTYIKIKEFDKNICQIMYIAYDDKEV